jgi:HicA toxin of bacterial toxin-antitoxin,
MARKHDRMLSAIFARPVRVNIAWNDVVSLLEHLGAVVNTDSGGSMVDVVLNGVAITLHKPHPQHEIPAAMVRRLRIYLDTAGIEHA